MLQRAYDAGLTHYNLTEHIPRGKAEHLYPEEIEAGVGPGQLQDTFQAYVKEARRQQAEWNGNGKLRVLVGAELENVDSRSSESLDFVHSSLFDGDQCSVDYLVGSVHHVYGVPIDFDEPTFRRALDEVRKVHADENDIQDNALAAHLRLTLCYLDAQHMMLTHFQPEVIGHFDLCRLYNHSVPMTSTKDALESLAPSLHPLLRKVDQAVHRNVSFAVSYGALFEVNSASVRKGWPTPYPGKDVLDVILQHRGRLCLSDDAHSHEQVALNYHRTYDYLKANDVADVHLLIRSDDGPSPAAFPRGTSVDSVPLDDLRSFIGRGRG